MHSFRPFLEDTQTLLFMFGQTPSARGSGGQRAMRTNEDQWQGQAACSASLAATAVASSKF